MVPKRSVLIGSLAALIAVLHACTMDRATSKGAINLGPTPLKLSYPAWAADSIHKPEIPYDNPTTVEGVALGRRLFYEKALSHDGSMSCASCHIQAHAFSDPRRFSSDVHDGGTPRNSMALINLAWSHFFFWDARAHSLELQAFEPVTAHQEMFNAWPEAIQRLKERPGYEAQFQAAFGTMLFDSLHVVYALAQFERTLISFDSPFDRFHYRCDSTALTPSEQRGLALYFGKAHCADCHELPVLQDHTVINIGLDSIPTDKGMGARTGKAWHVGRFKTPTVRNCEVSAPYMHDGRFATLEEVVDFYMDDVHLNTPNFDDHMFAWELGVVELDQAERADLVAFLKALTDTTFLNDPSLSDPNAVGRH